jgi:hypothetical protein
MPTKLVTLQVLTRDENNEILNNESAQGTTEDEGTTVVIDAGYVPNILTALPSDILRTVHQPSVDKPAPTGVDRTEDIENSKSILAFTEA